MESLMKTLLSIFILISFTALAEDEGLTITEKNEHWIRFKLDGPQFLKNKSLTYLIEDNNKAKTCYQINIDNKLGFKFSGIDGLYMEGKVELNGEKMTLASTVVKVDGMTMPKSANTEINFEKDYSLWRHSHSNPYYKKGAYLFYIIKKPSSKYEFIYTDCKHDDICKKTCL